MKKSVRSGILPRLRILDRLGHFVSLYIWLRINELKTEQERKNACKKNTTDLQVSFQNIWPCYLPNILKNYEISNGPRKSVN